MLISSGKKLYLFLSKNKISQQKKNACKKAPSKKKNLTKKGNNYLNDISSKYTGKFFGQGKKTLCVFYREIKSESSGKKQKLRKTLTKKKKKTNTEKGWWGNLPHLRLRCVKLRSKKERPDLFYFQINIARISQIQHQNRIKKYKVDLSATKNNNSNNKNNKKAGEKK